MPDDNERYDNFSRIGESFKKKSPQQIKDEKEAAKQEQKAQRLKQKIERKERNKAVKDFVEENNIAEAIGEMSDSKLLDEYESGVKYFNGKDADRDPTQRAKQKAVLDLQKGELDKRGITEEIEAKENHFQAMVKSAKKAEEQSMTDSLISKTSGNAEPERQAMSSFKDSVLNRRSDPNRLDTIEEEKGMER